MGIETVFIGMLVVCAVTGLVHGYKQELGVTIVLMFVVGLLQLIEVSCGPQFNAAISYAMNAGVIYQASARGIIYVLLLLMVIFVIYQLNLLRFPGPNHSAILSLGNGALNGYLLAGSLWYYLGQAGWPLMAGVGPYSTVYRTAWNALPPNVFTWPLLMAFGGLMLIIRFLR